MKILVTGGAGFIGSHVVDQYIAQGHEVAVIDNLSTGSLKNLHPQARFYNADITDEKNVAEIFADVEPEIVNHHAAQVSVTESQKNPAFTQTVNYQGTVNLLKQPGIKRFIFASTGGAMFSDPASLPATEETPAHPVSTYGISKLSAEQAVKEYAGRNGFSYVILRYANVFGPRQNSHGESGVMAIFAELARAGKQPTIYNKDAIRDYVYVGDIARANLLALTAGAGVYHIGTGIETTNQQVFDAIAKAFNWQVPPRYEGARSGDVARSVLACAKALRELNWQSQITIEKGIELLRDYAL